MCGIFGYIAQRGGQSVDQQLLKTCIAALAHRGPDATGTFATDRFAFAHCRLSVIDPDPRSDQPFHDKETNITITYNGEIYNFNEIREMLRLDGYVFTTKSDTEVICKAFARWGINCLHRFHGMFAFALHDGRTRETYLARDRLGIKPLYYTSVPHGLVFASQPAAILRWPGVRASIDPVGLSSFLSYRSVFGERTLFRGLSKLPAGCWMRCSEDRFEITKWWSLTDCLRPQNPLTALELAELMQEVITEQLVSDSPVAALLSGGLDSSIIVQGAARASDDGPFCFTGAVQPANYDESPFAIEVANSLNLRHEIVPLQGATNIDLVKQLISLRCHPLGMHNEGAMYLLARQIGGRFKVLLSGEGADELFAGYGRIFRLPFDIMRNDALRIAPGVLGRRLRRHIGLPETWCSEFDLFERRYSYFPTEEKLGLASASYRKDLSGDDELLSWMEQAYFSGGRHPEQRISAFFAQHHLGSLLEMVDNTTMAGGIETRVPFTDHRIVSAALSLSPQQRLRWNSRSARIKAMFSPIADFSETLDTPKAILRDIYSDVLPASVTQRKKLGFPLPLGAWANSPEFTPYADLLLGKDPAIATYFDIHALRNWYRAGVEKPDDIFGRKVWLLSNVELFLRQL